MDHGILNVPLAKRGDIAAEFDEHEANNAAAVKDSAEAKGGAA